MLSRIEKLNFNTRLNPLQHGFQKGKSSKMVSLIYQEAVNYSRERGDVTYTCFMDAMKAFDMTWIDGVVYKLHNIGIQGKPLRLLHDMLHGASSRVLLYAIYPNHSKFSRAPDKEVYVRLSCTSYS
jgi:hypothetical protein